MNEFGGGLHTLLHRKQFHQLSMFMTPHEVGNLQAGDFGLDTKVRDIGDRLSPNRVRDVTRDVEMSKGIHTPIKVAHTESGEQVLNNGHHRSTVAIRTNRLVPVTHDEDLSSHYDDR